MTLTASPELTTGDWVDRAESLDSVIALHRDQSKAERRMAQPLFEALTRTGILEMMMIRSRNCAVIEEISRHDGSAGWNVMIWSGSGLFADYLPEASAEEIVSAGQGTVIGGPANLPAKRERCPADSG
jgi:hypothetical protein